MIDKLRNLWFTLRSSLWFVPTLMVSSAIVLSFLTIWIDEAIRLMWLRDFDSVYSGGPEGARAVLATIAGSTIGVTGVAFSITIVTLTLASSQFGPRLLRNFMRDLGNQIVLGTFLATFVYCLLILRTVRDVEDGQFVPHLSITCGLVLALVSLGALIYFIHHVSVSIQADTVVGSVSHDLHNALNRLYPENVEQAVADTQSLTPENIDSLLSDTARHGRAIMADGSGYLQVINTVQLMQIATAHECLIRFECCPGDFISQHYPLATVWPGVRVDDDLTAALHNACIVGIQRTYEQDARFAFHQLVEIAVRALSPGINDPFTAVSCIERIGAALCQLAPRPIPSMYRYDKDGQLRVIVPIPTFVDIVHSVFDPIRQYSRASISVTLQLLQMIAVVAPHVCREEDREVLLQQALMINRGCFEGLPEGADREQVEANYQAARLALRSSALPA